MLIIVGFIIVTLSVIGGYLGSHGKLAALWQPFELVIIGGAALGAFMASNPTKVVKGTLAATLSVFKGAKYKSSDYLDTLTLIHEMLHSLGLGENPPSTTEINGQVLRRCGS